MRTRRLPTGGLAALAVLLAALAVVVVAGTPPPHPTVEHTTTTTLARHHHVGARHDRHHRPVGMTTDVDVHRNATSPRTPSTTSPVHRATTTGGPTTTTPSPSTTTTTTTEPVTTTTAVHPASPTSRRGVFEGGRTTATEWLGAVRTVTVLVPDGVRVTLSVTCGFIDAPPATSFTSVTVRVQGGGGGCIATFTVPSSSPQPAPWRLFAS